MSADNLEELENKEKEAAAVAANPFGSLLGKSIGGKSVGAASSLLDKFKQGLMKSDEGGDKKNWMQSMSKLVIENKNSSKKKEQLMRYL